MIITFCSVVIKLLKIRKIYRQTHRLTVLEDNNHYWYELWYVIKIIYYCYNYHTFLRFQKIEETEITNKIVGIWRRQWRVATNFVHGHWWIFKICVYVLPSLLIYYYEMYFSIIYDVLPWFFFMWEWHHKKNKHYSYLNNNNY